MTMKKDPRLTAPVDRLWSAISGSHLVKKDPQLAEPVDGGGPGEHLRKIREEANMTVDQMAAALLLNTATIEALEADAYDRLPAPTFVRGYLRGYARVLGLSSGPILDLYDRQGFEPPPLVPDVTESTQAHPSDAAVRLVTYAVAAVLVLLVGLWWNSREDGGFGIGGALFDWSEDAGRDPAATATDESGAEGDDGEAGGESVAMAPARAGALPRGDEFVPPPPAGDTAPGGIDPAGTAPDATGTEGGADGTAALEPGEPPRDGASAAGEPAGDAPAGGDAGANDAGEAGADRTRGGPASGSDSDAAEGGNAPAPEGPDGTDGAGETAGAPSTADTGAGASVGPGTFRSGLVLEFEHESWVEVYDGDRSRLFFGLVQAGRVLGFDGPRPFDVLLGFGEDVRVTIDGQAFDHTPYLKYGVGRFSVGSSAGAATGASVGAPVVDAESSDGPPPPQDDRT